MKPFLLALLTATAVLTAPAAHADTKPWVVIRDPHLTVNLYVTISPTTNVNVYVRNYGYTNTTTTTVNVTNIITAFGGTYTVTNNTTNNNTFNDPRRPRPTTATRTPKPSTTIDKQNAIR